MAAVRSMHNVLGGTIDPHAAYLLLRGMKTLDVRVQRQNSVRRPRPLSRRALTRTLAAQGWVVDQWSATHTHMWPLRPVGEIAISQVI